ncbi:MAG: DUF4469 domain-containing protein [Treponema sp.]|nr:DUF4469 domain-containing protein [Treponema sp.]
MHSHNNSAEARHRIKVRLYPNSYSQDESQLMARTSHDVCLSIEQICSTMKNRGGYTGDYEELVINVRKFFDEAIHHLCNGYAVNTGYFSVHPFICGTFGSADETYDQDKNPVTFRFRSKLKLHRMAEKIAVEIDGMAGGQGRIYEYFDLDAESINDIFVPGNQFVISGHKIKIEGENPDVGVYFVPADDPSEAVKAVSILENTASRIVGIAPKVGNSYCRIEVRTQYSDTSATRLLMPKTIISPFVVEEISSFRPRSCRDRIWRQSSEAGKVSGL